MPSTILAVDDDRSLLTWLRQFLEGFGFRVLEAPSRDAAVAIFDRAQVDALILDLRLGSDSGLEVLRHVREHDGNNERPVLMLTGVMALSEDEEEAIRRNKAYMFYKPEGPEVLVDTLRRIMGIQG
jgi:DNA-binding response OmpR family regulator